MLTRPPSTRSVWPINSVKTSNSINASVNCCCPTEDIYINMLTRPPSTRSVRPIKSVKASNSINASVDCCCPTAARYINMLTRPPSTRSVWPINSINTSESRKFGSEVHSYFVRPTFDGRHRIGGGGNHCGKIYILRHEPQHDSLLHFAICKQYCDC